MRCVVTTIFVFLIMSVVFGVVEAETTIQIEPIDNSVVYSNDTCSVVDGMYFLLIVYSDEGYVDYVSMTSYSAKLSFMDRYVQTGETNNTIYVTSYLYTDTNGVENNLTFYIGYMSYRYTIRNNGSYVIIDKEKYEDQVAIVNTALEYKDKFAEIYSENYSDDNGGVSKALERAYDDVTALRVGPQYFIGEFALSALFIILNPSLALVVFLIVVIVYAKSAGALKKGLGELMNLVGDVNVSTAELALSTKLDELKTEGLQAETLKLLEAYGYRREVARAISESYPTIGSVCSAVSSLERDETTKEWKGDVIDNIIKFVQEERHFSRDVKPSEYVDAIRTVIDYVVTWLNIYKYAAYITVLNNVKDYLDNRRITTEKEITKEFDVKSTFENVYKSLKKGDEEVK